jgi:hypothetical protein
MVRGLTVGERVKIQRGGAPEGKLTEEQIRTLKRIPQNVTKGAEYSW